MEITKEQDESTVSFINNQTIHLPKYNSLRPSIETGFHSILKKYVIHTHSIYSNILACSKSFENLTATIFKNDDFIIIPYFPPGTILTRNILKEYNNFFRMNKKYPGIKTWLKFTLDRKDSSKPYTLKNISICCPLCNYVKGYIFSAKDFREIANQYIKPLYKWANLKYAYAPFAIRRLKKISFHLVLGSIHLINTEDVENASQC